MSVEPPEGPAFSPGPAFPPGPGPERQLQPPSAAPPPGSPAPAVFPNLRQTFLLLLLFLGFTLIAAFLLTPLHGRMSRQAWFLLVVVVGEGIGVLVALRLARWPLRRIVSALGFSTRTLGWLLVVGAGNLLLIGSLLYAITRVYAPGRQEVLMELFAVRSAAQFLLLFLTVSVAAPILEEILVRGILLRGLALNRGRRAGVLWSAFFFALLHLNPLQAAPAFVNGVVWAIVLLRTGSLGTTLFLHALNNGFVFLMVQASLLAARRAAGGGATPPMALAPAAEVSLALGLGLLGLWLLTKGLSRLPRAPERLASFWNVAAPPAPPRFPSAPGGPFPTEPHPFAPSARG